MRTKIFLTGAGAAIGLAAASSAAAQCGSGCQPPPPPPPPSVPSGPGGCTSGGCVPPTAPPCCGAGGGVNVNVNINGDPAAATRAASGAGAMTGLRRGATVIHSGGGAYFNVDQPYPMTIQGLAIEGSGQIVRTPYTATRRMEKRVVLQAVCIDDRNVPHPASQVRPDRAVSSDYEGEVYRCIAGAKLQWTVTEAGGAGDTWTCGKREALWHGRGGRLECRPEKPERDCNERSLLRRYGAGVKELVMIREETYTEYREEVVEAGTGAMIMLDGGVGGRVF